MSNTGESTPDTDIVGNNFLRNLIQQEIDDGLLNAAPVTRFPPEPNGFLHVGHASSICLNFGIAETFGGQCNLRFDDTNPEKESQEYIDAIKEDIRWLGFQWHGDVHYASDYFDTLYEYALHLIDNGDAYVCHLSADEAREHRGTLTESGRNSPYRERSVTENRALFESMRNGELEPGAAVLRAKIDMSAGNINLRDPIIYRIRNQTHHQTGDKWCIYPTYDFTHGQSDAIEGVTHSFCTLEFADHRPLYEWFIERLPVPAQPKQTEFARLNLNYTITSKRKLKQLVDEGHADGWDDPRMSTISGMRRRGFTPASIRNFCAAAGIHRSGGIVDLAMLEHAVRTDLDKHAPRAMCVLDPIKLVLTNYDADKTELLTAPSHPQQDMGERQLPFGREIFIEREDFRESANKKYKRLVLGKKVRLRSAYVVIADSVVTDDAGEVTEVHCRYEPETLGADPADGVKPKGVIHWVAAAGGKTATVRLYDRMFAHPSPDKSGEDFLQHLNPESLRIIEHCPIEPGLATAAAEDRFQFERTGYFVADRHEHSAEAPVFNRCIGLRDSWAGQDASATAGGNV